MTLREFDVVCRFMTEYGFRLTADLFALAPERRADLVLLALEWEREADVGVDGGDDALFREGAGAEQQALEHEHERLRLLYHSTGHQIPKR